MTRNRQFTIIDAMDHRDLWGPWFRDPSSWWPWRAFLKALFDLPLSEVELQLYRDCTGRREVPERGFNEAWLCCGRRAGKSFVLSLVACYLAIFRDWSRYLVPGETGLVKVIATDRRQAKVIHRYCRALLTQVPALAEYVVRESDELIELSHNISIEVQSASFRTVRGFTVIAGLLDEIAYWRSDEASANPDNEILNALRPAMATVPGAFLLAASSPYSRRGELWNARRRWHGREDAKALVWIAPTRTMNSTVSQELIDNALAEDAAKGGAEYLAQFRTDIENYVSREMVEAAMVSGRLYNLPYLAGQQYFGFTDPSGAAVDSMTLGIAHRNRDGIIVLDVAIEKKPPFSPQEVVGEFAAVLRDYRLHRVTGDKYAGAWVEEMFRNAGIKYEVSEKTKSQLYLEFLPILTSSKLELPDNPRLAAQLCALERRTGRGSGRDVVDHPPGGHDDVINAAAGACVLANGVSGIRIWELMGRD
jgi:hypothetical protein